MSERVSVPISPELAARLKQTAKGRASNAPLLLQADGRPWSKSPSGDYGAAITEIVTTLGLGEQTTLYALRHSLIVRQLKRNVPIRIVAATHDTSVAEIERTYSKHIADHSDDISRAALLRHEPPPVPVPSNVVPLSGP
jgi:hypothetical protein